MECGDESSHSTPAPEEDGSAELLGILDGNPETYRVWAVDHYGREFPPAAVHAIYEHQPLSDRVIATLNSRPALSEITKDAHEIGYPCESSA